MSDTFQNDGIVIAPIALSPSDADKGGDDIDEQEQKNEETAQVQQQLQQQLQQQQQMQQQQMQQQQLQLQLQQQLQQQMQQQSQQQQQLQFQQAFEISKFNPNSDPFPPRSSNLFVNYLPANVRDAELLQMFRPFGEVETHKVMMDLATGMSRCYGFVKFRTPEQAEKAINAMNNYKMDNKTLVVKYANLNSNPTGATPRGTPSSNLYVKNLPPTMSDSELLQLFNSYGNIAETKVLIEPSTGYSRGVGFVRFSQTSEAENAINALQGMQLPGALRPLVVRFADTEEEKDNRKAKRQKKGRENRFSPYGQVGTPVTATPTTHPAMMAAAAASSYNPYAQYMAQTGYLPLGTAPIPTTPAMVATGVAGNGQERTLFVYNIPQESDDTLLYRLFSPYGAIESVKIVRDPATKKCKGFGFVKMMGYMEAWNAVQMMNGAKCGDRFLQVSFKQSKR